MCNDSKGPKTIIMVKYFTKQIIEVISLKSVQLRNLQIWCLWAPGALGHRVVTMGLVPPRVGRYETFWEA